MQYIFSSHNIQNLISIINARFLLYDLHSHATYGDHYLVLAII
jgi:hypothetical protein